MSAESVGPTIATHYCGQTQPHEAHTWEAHAWRMPPTGSPGSLIATTTYQCAGLTRVVWVRGRTSEEEPDRG